MGRRGVLGGGTSKGVGWGLRIFWDILENLLENLLENSGNKILGNFLLGTRTKIDILK